MISQELMSRLLKTCAAFQEGRLVGAFGGDRIYDNPYPPYDEKQEVLREAWWFGRQTGIEEKADRPIRKEDVLLRKNAERYCWLRDDERGRSLSVGALNWYGDADAADAAVDREMARCK